MKKNIQFFIGICFLFVNSVYCQQYEVGCYTKIDNSSQNFSGALRSGDQFGYSVDNIGDLDNDGIGDIIVGAFTDDDGGANKGAVYVLFLNEDDTVKNFQKISDTEGGFTGNLDDNDVFGASVAYLGDLNGDGKPEVAVGAEYDGDGGYWHGAVYILSLNMDGTVAAHAKISDYEGGFSGIFDGEVVFGTDVENIGDFNSDGIQDIVVGARRDPDGGLETGAIWLLFLNDDFTVKDYKKISETRGGFNGNLQSGDYFGGSVASLGDLDGDGVVDLAVGTYRDDDGGSDYGAFYVLFLNPDGSVKNSQKISATTGGGNFSLNSNAIFAKSIDTLSDIDGDGLIEILVGCARCNNSVTGQQTGAFFIVELNNDGTVSENYQYAENVGGFSGDLASGDSFGISVAFISNSNPLKVVAGAFKDAEGAVWIMNFSENLSDVQIESSASECSSESAEIIFANLGANSQYDIHYTRDGSSQSTGMLSSDSTGELRISGLPEGEYSGFYITKGPCTFNYNDVFTLESSESPDVQFEAIATSDCSGEDGSLVISGLNPNASYEINYTFNEATQTTGVVNSNTDGEITVNSLAAGIYSEFQIISSDCTYNYTEELEIEAPQSVEPVIQTTNPLSCSSPDGSISITRLDPTASYSVLYEYDSELFVLEDIIPDASGRVIIEDLGVGVYTNFELLYDDCSITFNEDFTLNAAEISIGMEELIHPECETANGSIILKGLNTSTAYTAEFTLNDANLQVGPFSSDEEGQLIISDLEAGAYSDIRIIDEDCSYPIVDFILDCDTPEEEVCYTFPLFFTPNNDGINDSWKIEVPNAACNPNFECFIFDRYGKLLKVLRGPGETWDGIFNNRPMPSDDYWIKIEFPKDLGEEVKKANISLIR